MKTLTFCLALIVMSCTLAFGQTYKILYSFHGSNLQDGRNPIGRLSLDKAGNLYGVTQSGGTLDVGTVFELSPNPDGTWTETVIYSFCSDFVGGVCIDGYYPLAALALDQDGNLFGTTSAGGLLNCPDSAGCGTVFELSPPSSQGGAWTETTLYNFCETVSNNVCEDGKTPAGNVTLDASGNLYGTTTAGGEGNSGVVFQLAPGLAGWTESVMHSFCVGGQDGACPDGSTPEAGVTFDSSGNLYGTTKLGGSARKYAGGTVYKLSPSSDGWTETVLLTFYSPYSKGGHPVANVSLDASGNLYSTASVGGPVNAGSVFRVTAKGVLSSFVFNLDDGANPLSGLLIDSKKGAVYGTTYGQGANNFGNVFKIASSGNQTILYNFCQQTNCSDGAAPKSGLIANDSGSLFGTAAGGGSSGYGVVFEITP